ncbi:hypothetical protein ACS0TY_034360 [Phlomoides rotata]
MPQRDAVTWNAMMCDLVERADIDSAYRMFLQIPNRNLRSWTCMIVGFVPKDIFNRHSEKLALVFRIRSSLSIFYVSMCSILWMYAKWMIRSNQRTRANDLEQRN